MTIKYRKQIRKSIARIIKSMCEFNLQFNCCETYWILIDLQVLYAVVVERKNELFTF